MRWIISILFLGALQWYAYQAIKTLGLNRWLVLLYSLIILGIHLNFFIQFSFYSRGTSFTPSMSISAGVFMALVVFQLLVIGFLFLEDITRFLRFLFRFFFSESTPTQLPGRRAFVSKLALVLGAIPFASLLVGMIKGKYNYKVLKYELTFDDLPSAFDGFQITHISDIHSGSFDNAEKVNYGIDLINEQQSDVILFTGDIVNNKAEELLPWKASFSRLTAPEGVFSVLGNHDYGDYVNWPSPDQKVTNLNDLLKMQKEMGFNVLLNQTHFLEKENERIALVGVENWGKGGFKKAGDLNRAVAQVKPEDFKVLLSHDPSHWEAKVVPHQHPFQLTLSGHTHGMQFGVEIPGWIKWSPVKWRYKQWAGLYEQNKQWLNVNRGFGFLGYPGRVGIWPEITVITLKRSV